MDQTSSDNRTDQPFTIRKAETNEDLQEIAALADVIWHEHFTPIIGKEQVEYMLSRFQSYPALQDQVLTGYEYYRLLGNRKLCGYMAIRQDQDGRMFLSKLYIAKQYRGRHLAAFLFDFLKNLWSLLIFIYNSCLAGTVFNIDITYKQRYFIFFIQAFP